MSGKRQVQAIVWDIDGTLLDTAEGLVAAYQYTIRELHLRKASAEELATYIGPTPKSVFMQHFGLDATKAQEASDIFRERYKKHDLFKARAYPCIVEVLKEFQKREIKQAIATNKRQDYAEEICRYFRLDSYCSPICGTDNLSKTTKAESITKCLTALQEDSSQAIMIGDTEGDGHAADGARVRFLGVNYGYGFRDVSGYANSPQEILDMIEGENIDMTRK